MYLGHGLWSHLLNHPALVECLTAVRQAEFNHTFPVQLVEQLELAGQLVGLLPLGSEFCPFLVIVVVRQVLTRIGVPAKGPEAVEMDLIAHGRGQRVHEDSSAETFGGQVFGLPVSVRENTSQSPKIRSKVSTLAVIPLFKK